MSTRAAAREGYEAASESLLAQAGVRLEGRQIQRLVTVAATAKRNPRCQKRMAPAILLDHVLINLLRYQ